MEAIELRGVAFEIDEERCLDCGSCIRVCPVLAIVTEAEEGEIRDAWARLGPSRPGADKYLGGAD